jgi:hypothetical protein
MDAREKLDRLVQVLLQEETVAEEELTLILGPRPTDEAAPRGPN